MSKPLTAWSFSRWAAYELCPLQFKLRFIDGIKDEPSAAMARGDRVHKATAAYVIGAINIPPPEAMATARGAQVVQELRDFPTDRKLVEQQWGFTSRWAPTGWFGNTTWFRAILDVAVLYDDMTGEAVDWKTGRRYEDNDDQMELFGASFLCKYPPAANVTTRLVYLDSGEEVLREYGRDQLPSILAKWERAVVPMFTDTVFAPKPNDRCRFCSFSKNKGGQCRFG